MTVKFNIELDKRFKNKAAGKFEKYRFEVGVLKNARYRRPRPKSAGLTNYAGGPARKVSRKPSKMTLFKLSKIWRKRHDYLRAPFEKKNSDIVKFSREFFKYAFGRSQARRLTNMLQAIVRNPILRGDYGNNSRATVKAKGFNRYGIDTAQWFKSIKARVWRV